MLAFRCIEKVFEEFASKKYIVHLLAHKLGAKVSRRLHYNTYVSAKLQDSLEPIPLMKHK